MRNLFFKVHAAMVLIACMVISAHLQSQTDHWCATDAHREMQMQQIPDGENLQYQMEMYLNQRCHWLEQDRANRDDDDVLNLDYFIIPVVFHVVYDPAVPATNIPFERIVSQLNVMNDLMNSDVAEIDGVLTNQQNAKIQFCLAQNTGSASCPWNTNEMGVMRYSNADLSDHSMTISDEEALMTGTDVPECFPFDKYMNVWVVKNIGWTGTGTVIGYAPQPLLGNSDSASDLDGIVMRYDAIGSYEDDIENEWSFYPNLNLGKVMVHEIGHYFNLYHVFHMGCYGLNGWEAETNNCQVSGDFVCDTPAQASAFSAQNFVCTEGATLPNTCTENYDWTAYIANQDHDYLEIVEDSDDLDAHDFIASHMNYSRDACRHTFSAGQVLRMHAYLTTSRTVLSSGDNLVETGVAGGECAPAVLSSTILINEGFIANACINESIGFSTPNGEGYAAVSWVWDFDDGSPTASGAQVSHTYSTGGIYSVSLVATDAENNSSFNQINLVVSSCSVENVYMANWVFGDYMTIDFTSAPPTVTDIAYNPPSGGESTMIASEGCITICDELTGNILFYSNGLDVWDDEGNNLNNNEPLLDYGYPWFTFDNTCTNLNPVNANRPAQSAQRIVCSPWPNHPNEYFIFVPASSEMVASGSAVWNSFPLNVIHVNLNDLPYGNARLWGITNNMSTLPDGLPNPLYSSDLSVGGFAERAVLIPHCNGTDFWFIGGFGNTLLGPHYKVILITELGLSDPTMMNASWSGNFQALETAFGEDISRPIYASPDNSQILDHYGALVDFNSATGELIYQTGNTTLIDNGWFSPSGNYVYSASLGGVERMSIIGGPPYDIEFIPSINPDGEYGTGMSGPEPIELGRCYLLYTYPNVSSVIEGITNADATDPNDVIWSNLISDEIDCMVKQRNFPYFLNPNNNPSLLALEETEIAHCLSLEVELSIPVCYQAYEVHWDFGDGTTQDVVLDVTHEYTTPGVYTVTVTVSRGGGQLPESISTEFEFTIPGTPVISVQPNPICVGQLQELATSEDEAIAEWTWTINGGGTFGNGTLTTTGEYNTIIWTEAGTWTVTINGTPEAEGCPEVTSTVEVVVNGVPEIEINSNCGFAEALVTQGLPPYTVEWFDGQGNSVGTGAEIILTEPDTYSAMVTDANGCSNLQSFSLISIGEDCCEVSSMPPPNSDYLISSTDPDWADATYVLDQDLVIQAGVHFGIYNCNLYFTAGTGIVLQTGADLTVDNNSLLTKISGCDGVWRGIEAFRGSGYANDANKSIITIRNSEVSYAQIGLRLELTMQYDFNNNLVLNTSTHWAQPYIVGSTFINNLQDIKINGYGSTNNVTKSYLGCIDTRFVIDENFEPGLLPVMERVRLNGFKNAANFTGCKFINSHAPFLNLTYEVRGLSCYYAALNMSGGAAYEQDGLLPSRFIGFTKGIFMRGNPQSTSNIQYTDFQCWRGCYLQKQNNTYLLKNRFRNFEQSFMTAVWQQGMYVSTSGQVITVEGLNDPNTAPYAIYLDGNQTYTVQDNDIDTHMPAYGTYASHGVLVNNTGQFSNNVRRNYFHGMARALKFQGNNRATNWSTGSKYKCNWFGYRTDGTDDPNRTDIRELLSTTGSPSTFGVPHQGTADHLNHWNQSNCSYCTFDDVSNAVPLHRYYRLLGSVEPLNAEVTVGSVQLLIASTTTNCTNHSGIAPVIGGDVICDEEKANAENSHAFAKVWYEAVVDGGNTEELEQQVLGTDFSEALQTYYDLMQQSPNLSDEVMIAALQKYEIPNVLLTQILSSNPSAAKSPDVQAEMNNRPIPFDEYQQEQIALGLYMMSSRESLEDQMGEHLTARDVALRCMITEIEGDATQTDPDATIDALLEPDTYWNDRMLMIERLAGRGDYDAAIALAEDAQDHFRLSNQDRLDMEALADILEIEKNLMLTGSATLNPHQINSLEAMLETTSSIASSRALLLMIDFAGRPYQEPILDEENDLRSAEVDAGKTKSQLKIYPNPTHEMAIVEYSRGGIATIELYDLSGRKVMTQSVNTSATQFIILLKDLAPSLYEVRLLNASGSVVASSSVVIE